MVAVLPTQESIAALEAASTAYVEEIERILCSQVGGLEWWEDTTRAHMVSSCATSQVFEAVARRNKCSIAFAAVGGAYAIGGVVAQIRGDDAPTRLMGLVEHGIAQGEREMREALAPKGKC